jgi:hypothetical protein
METTRLRKERDEAVQKAQSTETCLAKAVNDSEPTAAKQPSNYHVHTEVIFVHTCRHTSKKHWYPDGVTKEECSTKERLTHRVRENCIDCRKQEAVNRDAAVARLHRKSAADDHRIEELGAHNEELERQLEDAHEDLETLLDERDGLVARLTVVEGEAAARLTGILERIERQNEDFEAQLETLNVAREDFDRQYDEQAIATETVMPDLEERMGILLVEFQDLPAEREMLEKEQESVEATATSAVKRKSDEAIKSTKGMPTESGTTTPQGLQDVEIHDHKLQSNTARALPNDTEHLSDAGSSNEWSDDDNSPVPSGASALRAEAAPNSIVTAEDAAPGIPQSTAAQISLSAPVKPLKPRKPAKLSSEAGQESHAPGDQGKPLGLGRSHGGAAGKVG